MASEFSFSIDGLDDLAQRLRDAVPVARENATAELYQYGEEVMAVSKEERVPVDTGALMNSGKVMPPDDEGQQAIVDLGFGDESAPYAVAVHENMDPKVHWSRPGSGPKFLENPLKETQDKLPGRILEAYKNSI